MNRRRTLAAVPLIACLLTSQLLSAECIAPLRPPIPVTGAFCGVAFDQSGEALTGEELRLLDSSKNIIATAQTDSKGLFQFSAVAQGVYFVSVEGFNRTSNTIEIIKPGARCERELRLDVIVNGDCGSHIRLPDGTLRVYVNVEPLET